MPGLGPQFVFHRLLSGGVLRRRPARHRARLAVFLPPSSDVEIDPCHAFVAHVVCAPIARVGTHGLRLVKRLPRATSYGCTTQHSKHFVAEMFSEAKRSEI